MCVWLCLHSLLHHSPFLTPSICLLPLLSSPLLSSSLSRYVLSRIQKWIDEDTWTFNGTNGTNDTNGTNGANGTEAAEVSFHLNNGNNSTNGANKEASKEASKEDISAALERSFAEDEGVDKGMIRVLRHSTCIHYMLCVYCICAYVVKTVYVYDVC